MSDQYQQLDQSTDMTGPTYLSDLSTTAAMEAQRASQFAGDPVASKYGGDFANVMGSRARHLNAALARHAAIVADDTIFPTGKARLIEENAKTLDALNYSTNETAENYSVLQEASLRAALLEHDGREDVAIRAKVNNYLHAGLSASDAQAVLMQLAAVTEFATFMTSSEGQSLGFRFGVAPETIRKIVIGNLTKNGNARQRALGVALAIAPGKSYRAKMLSRQNYSDALKKFRAQAPSTNFDGRAQRYPRPGA